MILFDLYRPAGTRSKGFFEGPVRAGALVGLDTAGFYPGYFGARQTGELISFAVMPDSGQVPSTASAFENLSFIEAEVGEHNDDSGKVTVRSANALGEWARRSWLTAKAGFDRVSEDLRPPADVLSRLRDELRGRESTTWVSNDAQALVSALLLIKCDTDKRAVVLCRAGTPSYLVRL
jgi:hypothetical protein